MRPAVALALAIASGCGSQSTFACEDDLACGAEGTCELDGWCSFPDDTCESGRRYGAHSGDDVAGVCVEPGGTSDGTPSSDSGETTTEPTTMTSLDVDVDGGELDTSPDEGPSESEGESTSGMPLEDSGDESSSTGSEAPPPDPIAWYSFDDLEDPYADDSGNGHFAWCAPDLMECPLPAAGAIGLAREFDGIVQHLHVDHGLWLETTAWTLAAWIAPVDDGIPGPQVVAGKPLGLEGGVSWELGLDTVTGALEGRVGDVTVATEDAVAFDGSWQHVAATWDGMEIVLYSNGVEIGSAAAGTIAFDGMLIGIGNGFSGSDIAFFRGAIDEVRIYDVALTPDQIADLTAR